MQSTALPTPKPAVTRRRHNIAKLALVLATFGTHARYTAPSYRITAANLLSTNYGRSGKMADLDKIRTSDILDIMQTPEGRLNNTQSPSNKPCTFLTL
jgi:hypothetical protein